MTKKPEATTDIYIFKYNYIGVFLVTDLMLKNNMAGVSKAHIQTDFSVTLLMYFARINA